MISPEFTHSRPGSHSGNGNSVLKSNPSQISPRPAYSTIGSVQIFPAPTIEISPEAVHSRPGSHLGNGFSVAALNPPQNSPRPAYSVSSNISRSIMSGMIGTEALT